MTAEAATTESRGGEIFAADRRGEVGRAGRGVHRARVASVKPCVDAARGDRRDGAASAVLGPECALRRRVARAAL